MLQPLVVLFLWLKFGYRAERPKNLPKNYIVLANHTTDWDPVLVGAGFSRELADTLTEGSYEVRFFLLDTLGKMENFFFTG